MLPLVEDYVRLRKTGGTGSKGSTVPVPPGADAQLHRHARARNIKCFGCGEGGDAIAFVEKLEQVDFVERAIEFLAQRFNIEIEYQEISAEAARKRERGKRLEPARAGDLLLRAHALGQRRRRVRARVPRRPRARRGRMQDVPSRLRARRADARQARAPGGLDAGGAARGRACESPRRQLLLAPPRLPAHRRARPRARLPGTKCTTTTRCRPSTSTRPRATSSRRATS